MEVRRGGDKRGDEGRGEKESRQEMKKRGD